MPHSEFTESKQKQAEMEATARMAAAAATAAFGMALLERKPSAVRRLALYGAAGIASATLTDGLPWNSNVSTNKFLTDVAIGSASAFVGHAVGLKIAKNGLLPSRQTLPIRELSSRHPLAIQTVEMFRFSGPSKTWLKSQESVLKISSFDRQGNFSIVGTGSVISKRGDFLTCSHAIRPNSQLLLHLPNGEVIGMKVKAIDEGLDLAILSPAEVTAKVWKPLKLGDPIKNLPNPKGADHYTSTLGFPGSETKLVLSQGMSRTQQTFSELVKTTKMTSYRPAFAERHMLTMDGHTVPGMSGGPVFDKSSKIIGVHTHSDPDLFQTHATSLVDILPFVRAHL